MRFSGSSVLAMHRSKYACACLCRPVAAVEVRQVREHTQEISLAEFQSFQEQAFGILRGDSLPLRLAPKREAKTILIADVTHSTFSQFPVALHWWRSGVSMVAELLLRTVLRVLAHAVVGRTPRGSP